MRVGKFWWDIQRSYLYLYFIRLYYIPFLNMNKTLNSFYDGEVIPYKGSTAENGIKGDSTIEAVSKLKPAFVKPNGTHTAANSSFLTDGASASLIMSEQRALELGYKPLAYLRDWSFKSCDPFEELLLGPTYCSQVRGVVSLLPNISKVSCRVVSCHLTNFHRAPTETLISQEVLERNGLDMESDVGVFEIHEAFAGQILSNLSAMGSQKFADDKFNGKRVGSVQMEQLNTKGGSLALGHPFGATGSRIVTTAARRLQLEEERFALVAACADGGTGHACILERYDNA